MGHFERIVALAAAGLALAACASGSRAAERTAAGIPGAVATPFNDLNMVRTEIPPRLAVLRSAYETMPVANCRTIATEVQELTNILGPDIDAPLAPGETLEQRLGDSAAGWLVSTLTSTMSDFIPFRSAVREATGASAHERRLKAAYERGIARRAYLKGIGAQLGCAPPAAPQPGAGYVPEVPRSSSFRPG